MLGHNSEQKKKYLKDKLVLQYNVLKITIPKLSIHSTMVIRNDLIWTICSSKCKSYSSGCSQSKRRFSSRKNFFFSDAIFTRITFLKQLYPVDSSYCRVGSKSPWLVTQEKSALKHKRVEFWSKYDIYYIYDLE